MKISLVSICLAASLAMAIGGCAKPPVRKYPRPLASEAPGRPQPSEQSAQKTPPASPPESRPADALKTPPAVSYDKPVAPIGTQPKVESPAGGDYLISAVTPLADQAQRHLANGDLDKAQSTAERAVRIDPGNAGLWHLMGRIQMAQGNLGQAEQLARKSNMLARGDRNLQARNWRLIADSRRARGDGAAAAEALKKAQDFESR